VTTPSSGPRRTRGSLRLLLFLARRSLFSSRLTLVLLTIAISAGAGLQIANRANLDGFDDVLLEEGLTHGAGDIRVESRDTARFADGDAMAARLATLPGVRAAVPVLVYPGAVGKKNRFFGAPIYGLGDTPLLPFHLSEGSPLAPGDDAGLLLGSSLAKRLGVKPGDEIELRVIFGTAGTAVDDDNIGRYTMTVRGVVSGSAGAYRFVYVDRSFMAAESGEPGGASSVLVHLHDHFAAKRIAGEITARVPNVDAVGWREDDPYLKNYLSANETIGSVSYIMIIVAISLPMGALLYIHVLKRRREIGILAAIGFGKGEVFAIYLLQAVVLVALGCSIGALIGLGLVQYFQANPLFQWETLVVRPILTAATFVGPVVVITLTALVAGSYPAWRGARTDPARVLRGIE
jgi:lipoprotein-releasing system permease protein